MRKRLTLNSQRLRLIHQNLNQAKTCTLIGFWCHREKLYPFFHLILALKTIFLLFMAAFSTGPRRAPIILPAQCLKTCYSLTRLTASLTILSAVSCTSIGERPPLLLEWVVLFLHVYPIMRSSRVVPLRLVALFAV